MGKEPELVQEERYPLDIAGLYLVGRPTSSRARILDSWRRAGVAHSERHQASMGILAWWGSPTKHQNYVERESRFLSI